MDCGGRSCFATGTVRECTSVLDRTGTGTRREIDHEVPPQVRFFTTIETIPKSEPFTIIYTPMDIDAIGVLSYMAERASIRICTMPENVEY